MVSVQRGCASIGLTVHGGKMRKFPILLCANSIIIDTKTIARGLAKVLQCFTRRVSCSFM